MLQGENSLTEIMLRHLNSSGSVHMVPASLQGRYVIRFTVTSHYTLESDIERDWTVIAEAATAVLRSLVGDVSLEPRPVAPETLPEVQADDENKIAAAELLQRKRDKLRRRDFGLSLLLSSATSTTLTSPAAPVLWCISSRPMKSPLTFKIVLLDL